jgi:hypothetical protein
VLSPTNPLGIKAGGEGGTTPALAVVVSAIVDALKDYGIRDITMPATPFAVWQAIRNAQAAGAIPPPEGRAIAYEHSASSPSPRLRGEGRGEGGVSAIWSAQDVAMPPRPARLRAPTSPRERGEVTRRAICDSPAPKGEG